MRLWPLALPVALAVTLLGPLPPGPDPPPAGAATAVVTAPAAAARDADHDGLAARWEAVAGTEPAEADTDDDGLVDGADPDIVATTMAALPDTALRAPASRLRARSMRMLGRAETALLKGRVAPARRLLRALRARADGCPARPDGNDWLVSCRAQRTVRALLRATLGNRPSVGIDHDVRPAVTRIPGPAGQPDRPVGAVAGPDGTVESFVADEIVVHPRTPAGLRDLLDRYDGTVIRSGEPITVTGRESGSDPASAGWYLVRVRPRRSPVGDLAGNLESAGLRGLWSFSTAAAQRLMALVAREHGTGVSANVVGDLSAAPCSVCEHPTSTGYLDWSTRPWFGDGGLSISVPQAWEYLRYKGFPPTTPFYPVDVAVVDAGFELDAVTGAPLAGAADFPRGASPPDQIDEVDVDATAGGIATGFSNCKGGCWHGQMSFGVCCANAGNMYGAAGTSGGATAGAQVRTLLVRIGPDVYTIAMGIFDALHNHADVINTSIAFECGWICRTFDNGNLLASAVHSAKSRGAILVASAGNAGHDIGDDDIYPCVLDGAICVGAITPETGVAQGYSNWGSMLDIWGPAGIDTTLTSTAMAADADDIGDDELGFFTGTSCAAPFVTGVVALMRAVHPDLTYDEARALLASTANASSDPKVARGYVDAFEAVQAAAPNDPPTVTITAPSGPEDSPYQDVLLSARVDDPEAAGPWAGASPRSVVFTSDRDGELCRITGTTADLHCEVPSLSIGTHTITATGTDAYGATGSATRTVVVANRPPTVTITNPAEGASFFTSQQVNLHAVVFDPDETLSASSVAWRSSIDGPLGSGGDLWVSLSAGTHVLTASVTDSRGAVASATRTITVAVGAGYPTARILVPADRSVVSFEATTTLSGVAADPEDGWLTGTSLVWWSDQDGFLGYGTVVSAVLSGRRCTAVDHQVSLLATDSDGHSGIHTIQVSVVSLC